MSEMMMPCFKCPHGFVETFTECEKTQQPECEECRRPAREAVEQYFAKLCMNKNSKEANNGNRNDT